MPRTTAAASPETTSPSLLSLPHSLPSSSPTLDEVLERITTAKSALKGWQAELDQALDELDYLVESGEVNPDEPLTWNDFKLTRASRKSYIYPEYIQEQQAALKQDQELAAALGEAETKLTTYWTIRSL